MLDRESLSTMVRQWISLWSAPVDWDLFDRLHADDFRDGSSAGRPPTKAAFASALSSFVDAFPDVTTTVDDLVVDVEAQRVAVRWSAVGTNRRAYLGVGPTHRRTRITGIEIVVVRGGRVVERWGEWDIAGHLGG